MTLFATIDETTEQLFALKNELLDVIEDLRAELDAALQRIAELEDACGIDPYRPYDVIPPAGEP